MLKYALRENLLTPEPDDYMAQTVDARSYSGEEIVELMLKRGSHPLRRGGREQARPPHGDDSRHGGGRNLPRGGAHQAGLLRQARQKPEGGAVQQGAHRGRSGSIVPGCPGA